MSAARTAAARRALTQAEAAIAKARAALDTRQPEPAPDIDDSPLGRTLAALDAARTLVARVGMADVSIDFARDGGRLSMSIESVASLRALADVLGQPIDCHVLNDGKWYVGGPLFGADWSGARVAIHLITDAEDQRAEIRAWLEPLGVAMPADPAALDTPAGGAS